MPETTAVAALYTRSTWYYCTPPYGRGVAGRPRLMPSACVCRRCKTTHTHTHTHEITTTCDKIKRVYDNQRVYFVVGGSLLLCGTYMYYYINIVIAGITCARTTTTEIPRGKRQRRRSTESILYYYYYIVSRWYSEKSKSSMDGRVGRVICCRVNNSVKYTNVVVSK